MAPIANVAVRRAVADGLATAILLATIVGSGIMGHRLSGGNAAMTLLVNSLATGAVLAVLIVTFAPLSGAHLNPAFTLLEAVGRRISARDSMLYLLGQILGAFAGVAVAHLMFGERLFQPSHHARAGGPQLLSEFVATFGLFMVLRSVSRRGTGIVAAAVGGYIMAAYWFTASTSFANPAVTLARSLTDSFAGIRPRDVPGFVVAQLLGAASASGLFSWLEPGKVVE
ncbi:MAG TPA: MIP/aquaporin family protein [Candidatus Polarisedimenticolia bacterium]